MNNKIAILGSGIAGIAAGYSLKKAGITSSIFEKDADWGGLCGNFTIDDFTFDRFVHLSFTSNKELANLFEKSSSLFHYTPNPYNYYKGYWLKHPAQNNLAPLSTEEKIKIISDFTTKPIKEINEISNYEEWLRVQYGNYFAENFPFKYTRKYWGVKAKELETKWLSNRMYIPSLEEILQGSFETQDKNFYYVPSMYYPKKGAYRSILDFSRKGLDIQCNKKAIKIENNTVFFEDNTQIKYKKLISSIPLPEIIKILSNVPDNVLEATNKLKWTCGYQLSLGFNKPDIAKYLWFYIYDEDILPARIYSPSMKSPSNVPNGYSSLQAEIYFTNDAIIPDKQNVLEKTIKKLIEMNIFKEEDLIVQDIRFEPYANITFTHNIYDARKIIREYLSSIGIESIGRFGEWDYLWSHQAYESGMKIVEKFKNE